MNGQIQYGSGNSATSPATLARRPRHRLADPERFPASRFSRPLTASAVFVALLVVLLVAIPRQVPESAVMLLGGAWVALMLAMTLPSRAERAGKELAMRLATVRHAVNTIGDTPTREQLKSVLRLVRELELREEEVADEIARVRASMAALDLVEEIAEGRLPVVHTDVRPPSGDACHFAAPVRFGRRRSDESGQLLLTTHWLKYTGGVDLSIAWTQVADVQRAGGDLVVTTADRRRALRFSLESVEQAARCGVIAGHLGELAAGEAMAADRSPYPATIGM